MKFLLPLLVWSMAPASSSAKWGGTPTLERPEGTQLRIASYNVYWGSVFPQDNGEPPLPEGRKSIDDRRRQFLRVQQALSPDIWALQEVLYGDPQRETKSVAGITRYFSEATGTPWHSASDEKGRLVLSKYPIRWQREIATRVFGVLIDVPASVADQDVLLLNLHLGGGTAIESAKSAATFLRKVTQGQVADVPRDVSIVVCGDFNTRTHHPPYRMLRALDPGVPARGEVAWVLEDPHPRMLDLNDDSTIGAVDIDQDPPVMVGARRIDFLFYRSDRLQATNRFILNSLVLDDETLQRHGLKRNDSAVDPNDPVEGVVGLDHLPIIVDFAEKPPVEVTAP